MDFRGMVGAQGFKDRPSKAREDEPQTVPARVNNRSPAPRNESDKNNPDDMYSLIRNQPIIKTPALKITGPENFVQFRSDYLGPGSAVERQNQEPIWQKKAELEYLENVKANTLAEGGYIPASEMDFNSYLANYAKNIAEYVLPPERVASMPERPLKWEIVRMASMTRKAWSERFAGLDKYYSSSIEYFEQPDKMFGGDPGITSAASSGPQRRRIDAEEITIGIDASGKSFAQVDPDTYYAVRRKNSQWFEDMQVCVDIPENAIILAAGKRENGRFVWHMKEMDPKSEDFEFAKVPKDGQGSLRIKDLREFYGQLVLQTRYEESEGFGKFSLQCGRVNKQDIGRLGLAERTGMLLAEALLFEPPPQVVESPLWASIGQEESRRMRANMRANTVLFFDYGTGSIKPRALLFTTRDNGEVYVVDTEAKKRGRGKNEIEALKDLADSGYAGAGVYYFFGKKAGAAGTDAMEIVSKPAPDAVWNAMLENASYLGWLMMVPTPYTFAIGAGGFLAGTVEREGERISRLFHCGKFAGPGPGEDLGRAIDALFLASLVAGGAAFAFEKAVAAGAGELAKTGAFGARFAERVGFSGSIGSMVAATTWTNLQQDANAKLPGLGVSGNEPLLRGDDMPVPAKEYTKDQRSEELNDSVALAYQQYIVPTYIWCKAIDANETAIARLEKDYPLLSKQIGSLGTYEKKWRYLRDYQPGLYEKAFRQAAGEDADALWSEMQRDPYRSGVRAMNKADLGNPAIVKLANEALAWIPQIDETLLGQIPIHTTGEDALGMMVRTACTRSVWVQKNPGALRAYSDFSRFTLASTFKQILMHGGPLNEPDAQGISGGKRLGELMDAVKNNTIDQNGMTELSEIVQKDRSDASGKMLGQIRNAPDDCFTLAARYYMRQTGQYSGIDLGGLFERLDKGLVGGKGFDEELQKQTKEGATGLDKTAQEYAKGLRNLWINGQITTTEILTAAHMEQMGIGRQD